MDGVLYTPPSRRCSEGGRARGYYGAHCMETEYGLAVHIYTSYYVALLGGGNMTRGAGVKSVVVTGGDGDSGSTGIRRGGKDERGG